MGPLSFCLFVAVGVCAADERADTELEIDHALTLEFVTPHTQWARPYALGPTRVLFFCNGRGTQPRECVELMQRYDLHAKAVFRAKLVDKKEVQWHGGEAGVKRMVALLKEEWDCFVFLGVALDTVPSTGRQSLFDQVRGGAGLVFVDDRSQVPFVDVHRVEALPPFLSQVPVQAAYTLGQGRCLLLRTMPSIDYFPGWEVELDYQQERLGRAILWAAKKEPEIEVQLAMPKTKAAGGRRDTRFAIRLAGTVKGKDPSLHLAVRRAGGPVIGGPIPTDALPFEQPLTVQVPGLSAGEYHADVRLIGSKGIEGWATLPFTVVSARNIAKLRLAKDSGEIGDTIDGVVRLSGPPTRNETLRVVVLDRRRRELVRQDIRDPGGTAEFRMAIEPWFPMLAIVEARLLAGESEVARASTMLHVTQRHHGQFNFVVWDVPKGPLAPYAEESLAKHGVTVQLAGGNPPAYVAACDIAWIPYTMRVLTRRDERGVMRPFCWNDEQSVRHSTARLAKKYLDAREHGVFVWSLGDEVDTQGSCASPQCNRAYRDYLRESYGSLDAVNTSWDTKYGAWDEIHLDHGSYGPDSRPRSRTEYPRWFSHRAFESYNFARHCRQYAKAFAEIDPQAHTGFEGAGKFATGDDVDLIVRSTGFWTPYRGLVDEVIRSIAPRDYIRGNWIGYAKDADTLLQRYWRSVTRGADAVWWWRWDCIGRFHGWLAPDLRPYPAVKEILEDTRMLRDGLGDLLLKSTLFDDEVAILYSYPSVFAHQLESGALYGSYDDAHNAAQRMVRGLGLQFRYVTDRMLRLGEFDTNAFKVLLLPRAEAIGDREAEVIRTFVHGGGTVIADVRPGLYDDHCKWRSRGILDDLFGVARGEQTAPSPAGVQVPEFKLSFGKARADSSVTPAGAVPLGQAGTTGIVLTHKVGRGNAILLNFPFNACPIFTSSSAALAQKVFSTGGVRPAISLVDEWERPVRDVEITRWQNGGIEIVSLLRSRGRRQQLKMVLPSEREVYDLRNRRALGRMREVPVAILPNRAAFFVLCSRPAPAPELRFDRTEIAAGTVVKGSLAVREAEGLHAFRLDATRNGDALEWVKRVMVVGREPVEFHIPVAYNDPAGEYEIAVTDLFTQTVTARRITVLEK